MSESTTSSIEDLKRTYSYLSFIHQKFLTIQFYLEELSQADSSMKFVVEFANKIAEQIVERSPKEDAIEAKEESGNV